MPSGERWVPTLGFDLVKLDGYHVLKRGGLYVKAGIPDEEVSLRPVAQAVDYDAAVAILRALRAEHARREEASRDG